MKLAIKLCSLLIVGIIVVLAVDAYLAVQRESEDLLADVRYDTALLGHTIKNLVTDVWDTSGEERALQLIEDANRKQEAVQIRWVWLDRAEGPRQRPRLDIQQLGPVFRGMEASFQVSSSSGEDQLVVYVPVTVEGRRRGALELSESMARLRARNWRTITRALAVTVGLLAIGGASVTILGAVLVARPLGRLGAMVRRIGEGDLATRLDLRTGDELSALADALNRTCQTLSESQDTACREAEARIAAIEQLRHADRLATVGRLASGVAHEVGTPLNVISARAKQIRAGDLEQAEITKNATVIGTQSDRIARIVRQLLAFARPSRGERAPFDLAKISRRTINLLQPLVVAGISKEGRQGFMIRAFEWTHRHFPNLMDCRPIYVRRALEAAGFQIEEASLQHMWVPVEVVLGRKL
jgi:signal transduction histidine kinase